jgi:death-on-curing protein
MAEEQPIHYLDLMDLIRLREQIEREANDSFPILNRHGLMSALATPRQNMFGQELFPHLFDKAAILTSLLVRNHPFWDGNKRIALLALAEFLRRNGYRLALDAATAEALLTDVAQGTVPPEDLQEWIAQHAQALDEAPR